MTARTRMQTRVCTSPHQPQQNQQQPQEQQVVSLAQAIWSGTRSDTLYATANYHSRLGNNLIANRLRKVAAELKAVA